MWRHWVVGRGLMLAVMVLLGAGPAMAGAQDATPVVAPGDGDIQGVSVYNVQFGCDGIGTFDFTFDSANPVDIYLVDADTGEYLEVRGPLTYGPGYGTVPFQFSIPSGHENVLVRIEYPAVEPAESGTVNCPAPTPVPPTPTPIPSFTVSNAAIACDGTASFDYSFTAPQQIVVELYDGTSEQVINSTGEFILDAGSGTYTHQFPSLTGNPNVAILVARGPALSEDTLSPSVNCVPPTPSDGVVSASTTCAGLGSFTYNFSGQHQMQMVLIDPDTNAELTDIRYFGLRAGHGTYTAGLGAPTGHDHIALQVYWDTNLFTSPTVECVGGSVPPEGSDGAPTATAPSATMPPTQPAVTAPTSIAGDAGSAPTTVASGTSDPTPAVSDATGTTTLPNTGSGSATRQHAGALLPLIALAAVMMVVAGGARRRIRQTDR